MRDPGAVTGAVRAWLRLEGFAVLSVSGISYGALDGSWGWFALLFLAPDISFFGYLGGARIGAVVYNAAHSYVVPLGLVAMSLIGDSAGLLPLSLIWTAHIGFDRLLGYGLKYPNAFWETHLGRLKRGAPAAEGKA